MPMNTKEFKRLKDFMMRAASSVMDEKAQSEALQCLKRATLLLATHGYTWASALDKRVIVINEVETESTFNIDSHSSGHQFDTAHMQGDLERLFENAMAGTSGSFLETLESIHEQWERTGRISEAQRGVVERAAERYAERHPGGRVR